MRVPYQIGLNFGIRILITRFVYKSAAVKSLQDVSRTFS